MEPGHNVLEIGTGSGYNAALLAELVGDEGHVATVELERDIATEAYKNLKEAGYDREQVIVVRDDGGEGFPELALYDRIIVDCCCVGYPACMVGSNSNREGGWCCRFPSAGRSFRWHS